MANKGCLFILDEACDVFHMKEIGRILRESNNYFILITRMIVGWLPISIDSVFELENNNGILKNVPKFCGNNKDLTKIETVDYVLTEDSHSSRLFFKHYFNINVCESKFDYKGKLVHRDNATLHLALEADLKRYKRILVVFDSAAYAPFWELLKDVLDRYPDRISVLSWDSFETYILQCPKFGENFTKADVGCIYNSLEQLSTHILKERVSGYDKSSLPGELKSDNSFVQGWL